MEELTKQRPEIGMLWMLLHNSNPRQTIENTKFLLAQPFVVGEHFVSGKCEPSFGSHDVAREPRSHIWRCENDVGSVASRQRCKPATERARLLLDERTKRHVNVTVIDLFLVVF